MENTLRQDQIDALFRGAGRPTEDKELADAPRIFPYSFAAAGQISTEQMQAISMLNDLFARNLTHSLSAWLRSKFQVNLVSAEQIPFNEFVMRIPEINYVASVRLEPLGSLSVLHLDLSLAPPMIDLLLGGDGREGALRELTDIEESILGSVVEVVCRELTAAWQSVGFSFSFEKRQMLTQVARLISVHEKTLCLSFEIRTAECSGLLNLAFPTVVSNTILRRISSEWGRHRRHSPETRARVHSTLLQSSIGASLQLPPVRIPFETIRSLQPGSIVRLGLPAETKVELRAGGEVLSLARVLIRGGQRAARIESSVARGNQ